MSANSSSLQRSTRNCSRSPTSYPPARVSASSTKVSSSSADVSSVVTTTPCASWIGLQPGEDTGTGTGPRDPRHSGDRAADAPRQMRRGRRTPRRSPRHDWRAGVAWAPSHRWSGSSVRHQRRRERRHQLGSITRSHRHGVRPAGTVQPQDPRPARSRRQRPLIDRPGVTGRSSSPEVWSLRVTGGVCR